MLVQRLQTLYKGEQDVRKLCQKQLEITLRHLVVYKIALDRTDEDDEFHPYDLQSKGKYKLFPSFLSRSYYLNFSNVSIKFSSVDKGVQYGILLLGVSRLSLIGIEVKVESKHLIRFHNFQNQLKIKQKPRKIDQINSVRFIQFLVCIYVQIQFSFYLCF